MVSRRDGEACPCRGRGAPGAPRASPSALGATVALVAWRREEMIYYQQGGCKEDGCYMGEERLKRGWLLHGLKNRQHQDTKHGIRTSFLVSIIDASEEEIRSAKNFLLQQYAGYEESEEAIEGAYDKIITKSYSHRKKSRINLKSKLKKQVEESPSWVKALLGYFEVPSMDVISRRSLFGRISGWSIVTSAETGPTFQLALSLISCIYFLNDKMKSLVRVSTTGLVSLCEWLDRRFSACPSDPDIRRPTYLVPRAPYFAGCLRFLVLGLHLPQVKFLTVFQP